MLMLIIDFFQSVLGVFASGKTVQDYEENKNDTKN